jgi:recombination protein RecA
MQSSFDIKKFAALQASFTKQYGKRGVLITGKETIPALEVTPTGDPVIDRLLAGESEVGGIPDGFLIEIAGGFSSGKTTISMEVLLSYYERHPERAVAFIDVESAFSKAYALSMGLPVDSERFIYSRPVDGKQALTTLKNLIQSGMFSCIVVDSWAALLPPVSEKLDAEVGDSKVAAHALLSSNALREIKPELREANTTVLVLNQERVNLTPMGAFGKITTGGQAVPYYSDMRLSINRPKKDKDTREITVIKSKCQALPFSKCEIDIRHGYGLDRVASVITFALEQGHISKGGSWYELTYLNGDKPVKIQGDDNLVSHFHDNIEQFHLLCDAVKVKRFTPKKGFNLLQENPEMLSDLSIVE